MSMMKNFMGWIDDRYPMTKVWNEHLAEYYAPKNFNFWYFMGSLGMLVLVIQIVTGVWLAMSYKPDAELAFGSVEYIMRDVDWGWLIRYMHSTGASAFFVVIYLHMFRGLMYGSYRKPRELLWIIGVIIYLAMMATAFFGYLLPWGQMSYWGAQVIVNLFSAVPVIGPDLGVWVRGDYVISDATLNRFFALHFLLPFLLAALVFIHIVALHKVGSNNPDGIEIKKGPKGNRWSDSAPADGIPFHPYYSVKDIAGVAGFLFLFSVVVFFAPEMGGYFIEHPNFEPANPLKTPEHIAPVWYFTPFYAILRAVPSIAGSAFPGVVAMFASILVMFFLPWLDRSPVKSIRYKGSLYKIMLWLFVIDFIILGYLGTQPTTDLYKLMAQIGTIYYFAFFFLMPIYSKMDKTKPVPERVTE
ncbi:MAG: cytochrome b N-terminal domain-containing protein [Candidatus Thiodiazotropha taylori]|uniref:Cytochrome b n=3 Tax=Candidatus Thiodiazotropha TaxID=1913444 RepID=A0A7Z0VLC8_9GAMM|nr:cytochrome b N-terminal domain-containing protein [Candidatus Thiodiazotropha sp. (ex Lucina pensylvanica)]MBT3037371.1 cytochrome b N-terminal domain-containing protein [Candidatus Thiodiazotropha sp. (ex Codakia orbicularis)]MBV2123871.1 cytochrome b N-terminal domain-containing protein [Candidatus Thiodiazotropha taylori]MBW9264350.1 cytochrome b N-terminal domain-containing protein [Candidatus Thiodiazotropha sp. (ex. Lucinisca nassula)]MCG7862768.1 cytochrome b N-terminal domain-contain